MKENYQMMKSSGNGEVWPPHKAVLKNNPEEVKRFIVAALKLAKSPVKWVHLLVESGIKLHRRFQIRAFAGNLIQYFKTAIAN
jgi:hypothetical protein